MKDYHQLITNKEGRPLRILKIGRHTCIRVIRFAEALKNVGYEVDLLTGKLSYGTDVFDQIAFWHNEKQFKNFLQESGSKYDIVACHNEPDHLITWARDVLKDTPLIHNAHDLDVIRREFIPIPERKAFNVADAVVYVSKSIEKICNELHRFDRPTAVIYNYPTQRMVEGTPINWEEAILRKPTLVYEGGVNPIGDSPDIQHMNEMFKYRNLFPMFKQVVEQGNEVHVYPGNMDAFQTGQNQGCVMHPPTMFDKLLKELVQFKFNLIIFNNAEGTEDQVNFTTPNKLWDGLCSGLPAIACYCKETEKYIEKHRIGWTFNTIEEIGNCSQLKADYNSMLENIRSKRKELIFEKQIVMSENLYAELLGVEKKGAPEKILKQLKFEYGDETISNLFM